jgi:diacylglycerol kinase (ATP)
MNDLILVNPFAAGGRARKLYPQLLLWCQEHTPLFKAKAQIAMPESIAEALQILGDQQAPTRVIVIGGDGSLNQMLPELLRGQHEVGLVPYGSGNDCARAWGLHTMNWQEALQFAIDHPSIDIDVGRVTLNNGLIHYFHSSLAVGFDASVGNRALSGPGYLTGLPRYLLATFRELTHLKNWDMSISIDGQIAHQGTTLLASTLNTASYGGGMPAVPHALIDDGQLNLLVAGQFDRLQTLLMLPRLLVGQHLSHSRIQTASFTKATIKSALPLPIAADGETMGHANQIEIQVLPRALKVIRN